MGAYDITAARPDGDHHRDHPPHPPYCSSRSRDHTMNRQIVILGAGPDGPRRGLPAGRAGPRGLGDLRARRPRRRPGVELPRPARLHLGPRRSRDVQPLQLLRRPGREDAARATTTSTCARPGCGSTGASCRIRSRTTSTACRPTSSSTASWASSRRRRQRCPARTSREWIAAVFGDGIAKHFMKPYNFKVWAHPLEMMDTHWQGDRVPDGRRPPHPREPARGPRRRRAGGRTTSSSSRCSAPGCSTSAWPRRCPSRSHLDKDAVAHRRRRQGR